MAYIDPYKKSAPTLNQAGTGKNFSTANVNKQPAQTPQNTPYRGGLSTDFSQGTNAANNVGGDWTKIGGQLADADSDVAGAKRASYFLGSGYNAGVDSNEQKALLNMYTTRINQKNALAESIAGNETMRTNAIQDIYGESGRALGQGLKKTKENYSSRGLLYSGMREGGEQNLRSGIAAKTQSDVAQTNRESSNALDAAKRAYASIGIQNAQENIQLANQAFETANANSIARLQAYQQFGGGAGQMAGYLFSRDSGGQEPSTVTAGYKPDQGGVGGRQGLMGSY